MFVALVLLSVVLVHLYLWKRVVLDVLTGRRARIVASTVLLLLALLAAATMISRYALSPGAARPLVAVGYPWLFLTFYAALVLALGELVRLGVHVTRGRTSPERRRFLSRAIAGTAALTAAGTVSYGAAVARDVRVERREILLDRLSPEFDGFTVAAVSDIHLGPVTDGGDLEPIVDLVNSTDADVVAIVGDLVDGTVAQIGAWAQPLSRLSAPAYFVTGNHEYYSDAAGWVSYLPTLGVRVLRNERETFRRGDAVLHLAGCDDRTAADSGVAGHGFDLDAALAGRGADEPVVLLAHQPVMVEQAVRADVDLQISGHTHGGQLWPITYVALLEQPVLAGLTRVGRTWLYVTRGTGFWGAPVRVGSPPEVTLLTLRSR